MTVRPLRTDDLQDLGSMFALDDELSPSVAGFYRSFSPHREDRVVVDDGAVSGVISGTYQADFRNERSFSSLDLPVGPHALLIRIFVRPAVRKHGLGLDLLEAFATEALAHRCTYIVGHLDESSDTAGRRVFFERAGFVITPENTIGATPAGLLERLAKRRRWRSI